MVELMAAIEAREDQLVAALDQWNEARGLARHEAAKLPRRNGANSFTKRVTTPARASRARARTLSGMLAKLAFTASGFDAEEVLELADSRQRG
jgi:hypothetical protein